MRKKTNDEQLGDILKQMVKALKLENNLDRVSIENAWEKVMGQSIAKQTKGLTLRDGVLTVNIESSALRMELHYGREKIKKILNDELHKDAVKDVIVR